MKWFDYTILSRKNKVGVLLKQKTIIDKCARRAFREEQNKPLVEPFNHNKDIIETIRISNLATSPYSKTFVMKCG